MSSVICLTMVIMLTDRKRGDGREEMKFFFFSYREKKQIEGDHVGEGRISCP